MADSIFISYRRSDSQHAAFAVADRLRWAFGRDEVFLDRGSIEGGADWSATIRNALRAARVVLVLIGPGWLRVADRWGRRRLDDPTDWVRLEVAEALAREREGRVAVIPVYLDGAAPIADPAALDGPLQHLPTLQAESLPSVSWEQALDGLIALVARRAGLARLPVDGPRNPNGSLARPMPSQQHRAPLSDEEVRLALTRLSLWQLSWSPHPWGAGQRAQELTKVYEFGSFDEAVRFMAHAADAIDRWRPPHHPRWENQWKVVTVWFSTWDVGCRVTELDFSAARKLDRLYLDRPRADG